MADKIFIKRKLENDPFHMKEVEIIIPFYGEQARVTKLMESIFSTVFTNRYLITLVDDGSSNKHFIQKIKDAKIPGVRCFRQDQKGFGAAINHALKNPWVFSNKPYKQIPFVCIMHSDVYPEDNNWLSELGATLHRLKNSGVKMVSPMTNNSTKELIGTKGIVKEDAILKEEFLPLYCALCNRELFNRVGLFREFPYAGSEAEEFSLRMKKNGFLQAVSGNSWIHHEGGATLLKLEKDKKVQKILRNVEEQFLVEKKEAYPMIHKNEVNHF